MEDCFMPKCVYPCLIKSIHLNLFITQFVITCSGYNTDQCWTPNGLSYLIIHFTLVITRIGKLTRKMAWTP